MPLDAIVDCRKLKWGDLGHDLSALKFAEQWLAGQPQEQPFLLILCTSGPHVPWKKMKKQ